MTESDKIYIAGHRGLVGSAILRHLGSRGFHNLVLRTHQELDLTCSKEVDDFFKLERPDYVFLAAARVGGILANMTYPADFIRENLSIQLNVIDSANRQGVRKLLFLGSSCIYPRLAPQPISEDFLLTGPLEPTNEPYAIAKIAGIKLCQAYRTQYGFSSVCLMPTNVYGPGDHFDPQNSHVVAALLRKFHEAKVNGAREVSIWGTGTPRRELLHVDDLASALVFAMQHYDAPEILNVGVGSDISIMDLAAMIADVAGYEGRTVFDTSRPDGTPRKLLDVSRLHNLGWSHSIALQEGIAETYRWFLQQQMPESASIA